MFTIPFHGWFMALFYPHFPTSVYPKHCHSIRHDATGTASEPWNRTGQNRNKLEPVEPNRTKFWPDLEPELVRTGFAKS
jgi:hypothetical protein